MTTELFDSLREIGTIFRELHKPWALVGGLAVSVHVEPRFTRDIDVVVSVADDTEAEDFLRSWRTYGFVLDVVMEHDVSQRLSTIRTYRPANEQGVVIDLLFASSGIEGEIAEQAIPLEIVPGLVVPVARPAHLVALKLLAQDPETRPQDAIDLKALVEVLDAEEKQAAHEAIQLIMDRGYHRGRDLPVLLQGYWPR